MKKMNIRVASLLLFLSAATTSCLKDDSLTLDLDKTNSVTEFANSGDIATMPSGDAGPRYNIDLGTLSPGDTTSFWLNVDYAGHDKAPQDIQVTIDVDPSALTTYNTEHAVDNANYVAPPAGLVGASFPLTVTIPRGELFGHLNIPIKMPASGFDFGANYALPLKITATSVGTVSKNFGTVLYSLVARNAYDGVYSVVSGEVIRYAAPGVPLNDALSGSLAGNPDVYLVSAGSTSMQIPISGASNGALFWAFGNNSKVAGIDGTIVTVDPATNQVTMSCTGNATLSNWDGHDNYYDPETQTFHLAFIWNPTSSTRTYEVVLKYKKAR